MRRVLTTVVLAALAAAGAGPARAGQHPTPRQDEAALPPVEVVLYSDFQCPFCALFAKPFRELESKGVDGVVTRVVFKHFPLSIHPAAQLAHQAAVAAQSQGKFWEMHDLLFANPQRVQRADLVGYARQLGLDGPRFERDLDSEATKASVAKDVEEGGKAGVQGTPSYTINGKMYSGTKPYAQLRELIVGDRLRLRALAEVTDPMLSRGPASAPVVLELFADLQSPVTRPAMAAVTALMARYPDRLRLQFRNFPLSFHPQARLAHEAAMTAARDGRFWEFVAYVLDHQDSLREQDLIELSGTLGLDVTRFATTLQERRYAPRVEADELAGQQRGIRGSPVLFVNGKRIDGVPSPDMLTRLVEEALAAPVKAVAGQP